MFWLWKVWVKPSQGVFLDGERQFTLPICCYCRSHFVCFQTQLRKFPQQQPVWTETHTSEGIQNVMIWEDLHYSLRSLANVCLCVCVGGCAWGRLQSVRQQRAGNHIHMVKQLQRAPFSIRFYPPNTITKYLTHHPTHTRTADVLENRFKVLWWLKFSRQTSQQRQLFLTI